MLSSCSPTNDAGIHIDYTLEQFQNIALMNNGEPTHTRGGRLDLTFVSTFFKTQLLLENSPNTHE